MSTNNLKEINVPAKAGTLVNQSDYLSDFIIYLLHLHSLMKLNNNKAILIIAVNEKDNQSGNILRQLIDYITPTESLKTASRGEKGMKFEKISNEMRGKLWIDYFELQMLKQKGLIEDE